MSASPSQSSVSGFPTCESGVSTAGFERRSIGSSACTSAPSFCQRLKSYKDCQDTVLFVTASNPGMGIDSEDRRRTLMQWTRAEVMRWAKDSGQEFEATGTRIWFTTLELATGNKYGESWENIHGNKRAIRVGNNHGESRGANPHTC